MGEAGIYVPNGLGSGVGSRLLMLIGATLAESLCRTSSSDSDSSSCSCSCSDPFSASTKGWLSDDPVLLVLGPGILCPKGGLSPELPLLDDVRAVKVPRLFAVVSGSGSLCLRQ